MGSDLVTKSKLLRFIDGVLLRIRFKQKGILLVAVPLAFELLFITILSLAYVRAENDSAIAGHGRRVLVLIDGMTSGLFAWGAAAIISKSILSEQVFGNQITRRLQVVGRNAARLARAEPLTESLTGSDELSELDAQMQILAVKAIETSLRERAIIDNTADLILVLAPDLTIGTANAAAPRLLCWSVISLTDLPVLDLVDAEDRNEFAKAFGECRSSRQIRNLDFLVLKSDGDVLETRWSVLWSDSENSYFCLVRDISSEKRADKARQKFFAMVTHDIRSPLTTLYSFLDQISILFA